MRAIDADAFDKRIRAAGGMSEEELTEDFKDGVLTVLDMLKTQPTIEPEPHWIPCEERMPELDVYVIATTQWYEITMACRIGDGEWFINEGDSNAYDDDVIAWMPLPEPWRGEEHGQSRE